MIIDLRSDTITKPTIPMLEAMKKAQTGDDVFGEDTSVNELEAMVAVMFGKEAAMYCPSGTMSNQVAIKCNTQPGDEVICEKLAHVYIYEVGGIAFNAGCQVRPLEGDCGRLSAAAIQEAINPDDIHKARTGLVCLENTSNRGGGSCYDLSEIQKIRQVCDEHGLALHLDGARLFNAMVARQQPAASYGALFDSISVCLSKGLGCPVGSLLLGSKEFIGRARRVRKALGGGMRQAGYMAAAGIYALQHHIPRLALDHEHAKLIAEALKEMSFVAQILPVETNIIVAELQGGHRPDNIAAKWREKGLHISVVSAKEIRLVTHLDINRKMIEEAINIITTS